MARLKFIAHVMVAASIMGVAMIAPGPVNPAEAGQADFALSCDNGRTYPFSPLAVNAAGDVVTGLLHLRPRQAVHMRLIPMGIGYRYAGRGIWFDGRREIAEINWGTRVRVGCVVIRNTGETAVLVTKG